MFISDAAKTLECCHETVRRLDRRGILHAKRDYRGFRVFNADEVFALKEKRSELRKKEETQRQ